MHHPSHFLSTRLCSASLCSSSAPRIFPLPLPCSGRGEMITETHPFLLSWLCWSSDGDHAELAWFVSVGLQQPALGHRNNRNMPKALTARTVPLDKCLLQKTVSGSSGYKIRLEDMSSSSHSCCRTRSCLTSRTAMINLATDAAGRSGLFLRWGRSTW